jgi:hypothetical protein
MPTVAGLPPDIAEFAKYNGLTPAHELFDANIDRLVSTFLKSVPASPKSTSRKRLRQATSSVRAADPRGRVFFNNGWDGFDPSKDDDVLFHFDLKNPRLVRHIAVLRQLKPGAYTAQGFIAAKPELLLDPLEGEARLSICFGSADDCRQAEADYNFFFDHYHPVLPEAVTLNVLDGNEEAMWEWSTKIPAEWLVSEKPYVRESEVKRMQRTIQMWIDAHNAEIDRLRKRPPGK